jgi:hypothetical protein
MIAIRTLFLLIGHIQLGSSTKANFISWSEDCLVHPKNKKNLQQPILLNITQRIQVCSLGTI